MTEELIVKQQEYGAVAQLVAHLHGMQGVRGSSPLSSTLEVLPFFVMKKGRTFFVWFRLAAESRLLAVSACF